MLRVLELFAGIGACSKALTNLGIEHEIVDAVEIDKYAIKSFNAIHGTNFEPQDITKWDKDIECDLIMHGSPCQDFSVAGKGAGGDKDSGTRSSLMYETLRIVEKLKPKYVIWENVKNLLSKKHRHNFDAYLDAMTDLGYANNYQVLNAKYYGIPQNRERVFTVSIRKDIYNGYFFPAPIPLEKRLKDVLENDVDEKYYLSDEQTARLRSTTYDSKDYKDPKCVQVAQLYGFGKERNPQAGRVYDQDGICPTMSTMRGGNQEPKIVASRGRNPNNPSDRTTGAPTVQRLEPRKDGLTNTITSVQKDNYVAEPTPLQRKVCNEAIARGLVEPNDAIEYTYSNARLKEIGGGFIKKQNMKDNNVMSTLKCNPQQIGVCVSIRTANRQGYDMATDGDGVDLSYPQSKTKRGRVGHGVSKTLMGADSMGTVDNYRIRKLTPKECWRLMGFSDEDFKKAQGAGISNSQLYKQAGNSIVVGVLMAVLNNLIGGKDDGTRGESNHKEN